MGGKDDTIVIKEGITRFWEFLIGTNFVIEAFRGFCIRSKGGEISV